MMAINQIKISDMKRFYFFLVLLFAVTNANSQLLTENFSYTAGQTLTAN